MKKILFALAAVVLMTLCSCEEKADLTKLTPSGRGVGEYSFYFNDERTFALDPDNHVHLSFDGELTAFERTGYNYITDSGGNILTDANLEPIVDFRVGECFENSFGQVIFTRFDKPLYQWYLADSSGLIYTSPEYDEVLGIHKVFTAVVDGGILKLFTQEGEFIADLGEMPSDMYFSELIYQSNNPGDRSVLPSYFLRLTDSLDCESETTWLNYEYDPNTQKVTVLETAAEILYDKPVLYLYPETETEISVKFEHPERLTTVYPTYTDGWQVTASPDGTLTDGEREYYALYWEENSYYRPSFDEGFCVAREDSVKFLEASLDALGFTSREANEFIMYWLPILERSEYNLVYFELTESREAQNKLLIEPTPDSLLRVAIHVLPTDESIRIDAQKLTGFIREGFTAVEWGGCIYG